MRKRHQKQILELIQTLFKAKDEIKRLFAKKEYTTIMTLLADCQNAAENIGRFIEGLEGEGTQTVSLLEEYCELLYRTSQKLNCRESGETLVKPLKLQLDMISHMLKKEFGTARIEMAFFPYKASMWDSLESVWLAAKEDVNCDAYVVPIPYYDRLSDGTFGQMHYEGDLYPADVPVIDWKEYDVEGRHPDVVFIHSPYDAGNFVTSIHPDYYSKELKKHTDLLVYVPYFITFGDLPEDFCTTAGCINADRVIVQSESVRQVYIRAFQMLEKEKGCINMWGNTKEKFLALGSPKFDKVVHSNREDFHLPDGWKRLIGHPESMRKKVIFYNTSLNAMLRENEEYLVKLRSSLDVFKNEKNIILWWRPHPLSEATLCSMRPQLLSEYKRIIDTYRKEGWGIYDDTPDLHRAIAYCDAYYGDNSSVIELFLTAQKPVLIQAVQNFPVSFENFITTKGASWFTALRYNGLFRLDHKTKETDFVGCFPREKDILRQFYGTACYKNLLLFAPFSADGIAIYQIDCKEFISIPLRKPQEVSKRRVPYSEQRKFSVCVVYGEKLFLFPCTYPAVVMLDLETCEAEYLYEPVRQLEKWVKHKRSYYFRNGEKRGKTVTLWCVAANAFVEFDMETYRFKLCYQINRKETYAEAIIDNTGFWLLPGGKEREILKVSKDFEKIQTVDLPKEIITEQLPFLYSVVTEESLYLFPGTARSVIQIYKKDNHIEEIHIFDAENMEAYEGFSTDWKFFFAVKSGNTVFAFNNFAHQLVAYSLDTGSVKSGNIKVDLQPFIGKSKFLTAWKAHFTGVEHEAGLIAYEDFRMPLGSFLEALSQEEPEFFEAFHAAWENTVGQDSGRMNGFCGHSIYEYARKYIEKE